MKTTQFYLTVSACAALLYGLTTATTMAGPHLTNTGTMKYSASHSISAGHATHQQNQSHSTRVSGQHQTTRTNNQASHSYRAETRIQTNHAGTTKGVRADYSHGRTNNTHTNSVRVQSNRGTASGSSHSSHSRQQRFGF